MKKSHLVLATILLTVIGALQVASAYAQESAQAMHSPSQQFQKPGAPILDDLPRTENWMQVGKDISGLDGSAAFLLERLDEGSELYACANALVIVQPLELKTMTTLYDDLMEELTPENDKQLFIQGDVENFGLSGFMASYSGLIESQQIEMKKINMLLSNGEAVSITAIANPNYTDRLEFEELQTFALAIGGGKGLDEFLAAR